jgi:nitroimidazol reductase NimA-like FMN-containing flavoprotein (pyridoxamine 5'-phosphate oxidase superfamily)
MKRSDREITRRADVDELVREALVCRLGFAVESEPYIVPVSFGFDGDFIYFHTAKTGKKIDFIEANRRVCFELERDVKLQQHPSNPCNWSFSYESVIGYGYVKELDAPEDKFHGLNQIMIHYSGREWEFEAASLESTRVWRVEIESMTGKRALEKVST